MKNFNNIKKKYIYIFFFFLKNKFLPMVHTFYMVHQLNTQSETTTKRRSTFYSTHWCRFRSDYIYTRRYGNIWLPTFYPLKTDPPQKKEEEEEDISLLQLLLSKHLYLMFFFFKIQGVALTLRRSSRNMKTLFSLLVDIIYIYIRSRRIID